MSILFAFLFFSFGFCDGFKITKINEDFTKVTINHSKNDLFRLHDLIDGILNKTIKLTPMKNIIYIDTPMTPPIPLVNFKTSEVANSKYSSSPYRYEGKLFFKDKNDPPGYMHVCSGTVIDTNKILTAAHCILEGGSSNIYKDFIFIPQYNRDSLYGGQKGVYSGIELNYYNLYRDKEGMYQRDIAIIKLSDNEKAPRYGIKGNIKLNVGGQATFDTCFYTNANILQLGYPSTSPFDGEIMIETSTSIIGKTTNYPEPNMWKFQSSQTQGCSGGGFFLSGSERVCCDESISVRNSVTGQYLYDCCPIYDTKVLNLKNF